MSRARHKKAEGGKIPSDVYAGKESNVAKEAEDEKDGGEMKKGGKVAKKKSGGKVEHKVEGEKAHRRLDKPKRARGGCVSNMSKGTSGENAEDSFTDDAETPRRAKGGRVGGGSDMSPLSSASKYD